MRELIDEVLFLSELESGSRVVSLGTVAVRPELDAVVAELEERASRAGVSLVVEGDPGIELEIRPRMLRVDRAEPGRERDPLRGARRDVHARRRADARGSSCCAAPTTASASRRTSCRASSSASTAPTRHVPRAAPASGLAIVKHIVTQAGGQVEARGGRGAGLEIRCVFPSA